MARKKSKGDWKIYGNVFDQFTIRILQALAHKGYYDNISHPLKVGKEANVFLAKKENEFVIAKIYMLENCNFNKMMQYLRSDPRFPGIAPRKREIIFAWVQREYRNLHVARQAGVRVPTPIIQKNNVLIEEFIGTYEDKYKAAQQLKNICFDSDEERDECYKEIINQIVMLWNEAGIVHADLSEFNILYHDKKPVFIDFSQGTSNKDQQALAYMERDCKNITRFFNKYGLDIDTFVDVKKRIKKIEY